MVCMKVAIVRLPYEMVIPRENGFQNLHVTWKPPDYVLDFWASGALIEYLGDNDYEAKTREISDSYKVAAERHNELLNKQRSQ